MTKAGSILLINDQYDAVEDFTQRLLTVGGYAVSSAFTSSAGAQALRVEHFDVVILKSGMLDQNTKELVGELKKIDPQCVIISCMDASHSSMWKEVLELGVYDFITTPVNTDQLLLLVKRAMELSVLMSKQHEPSCGLHEHNASLQKQNTILAQRIEDSAKNLNSLYEDLRSTYMRTIKVLSEVVDAKDHYTYSHSENVARIASVIAQEMRLYLKDIEKIQQACELHDLGKVGVRDDILGKPCLLTAQEWEQVKRHPVIGAEILEPLIFLDGAVDLVRQHHEHYDGSGYPEGRKGEDILLGARIIHLADAYEAMRSQRSYRKVPLSKEEAIAEIQKHTPGQFDPKVVDVFLRVVDRL